MHTLTSVKELDKPIAHMVVTWHPVDSVQAHGRYYQQHARPSDESGYGLK